MEPSSDAPGGGRRVITLVRHARDPLHCPADEHPQQEDKNNKPEAEPIRRKIALKATSVHPVAFTAAQEGSRTVGSSLSSSGPSEGHLTDEWIKAVSGMVRTVLEELRTPSLLMQLLEPCLQATVDTFQLRLLPLPPNGYFAVDSVDPTLWTSGAENLTTKNTVCGHVARCMVYALHRRLHRWREAYLKQRSSEGFAAAYFECIAVQRQLEFELHYSPPPLPPTEAGNISEHLVGDSSTPKWWTLSTSTLQCMHALDVAWSHQESKVFRYPVDTVAYGDYLKKITDPLCLSDVYDAVRRGEVMTEDALRATFDLIKKNCATYNGFNNPLVLACGNVGRSGLRAARDTHYKRDDGTDFPLDMERGKLYELFPWIDANKGVATGNSGGRRHDESGCEDDVVVLRTIQMIAQELCGPNTSKDTKDDKKTLKLKPPQVDNVAIEKKNSAPASATSALKTKERRQPRGKKQPPVIVNDDHDPTAVEEKVKWAQCDVCDAWHITDTDYSHLPRWTCSDIGLECVKGTGTVTNTMHQDIPEVIDEEVAEELPKKKKEGRSVNEKRGRQDKRKMPQQRQREEKREQRRRKRPSGPPSPSSSNADTDEEVTDEEDQPLYKMVVGSKTPATSISKSNQKPVVVVPLPSKPSITAEDEQRHMYLQAEILRFIADANRSQHPFQTVEVLKRRYTTLRDWETELRKRIAAENVAARQGSRKQ